MDQSSVPAATASGPAELAYCPGPTSYSDSVQIRGQAQYIKRIISSSGLGAASLTDPTSPSTLNAIRFAEVRVTDRSGALVQCGETDATGAFNLNLPRGAANYDVHVMTRANNAHLSASVLNAPNSNAVYSLTTSVNAAASTNVALVADAKGDTLGGAFNVLDRLADANAYLVAQVGHCSNRFQGCANYNPLAHKVSVYWQKGFNPNTYFGLPNSALSFYLPGYSRLFILGGMNGDTDHSDTDHYDDSVIIHEYGHFLEDNWLKSDSPGGMHDGDELLDPRLAWSEGWGDFIQAAVRGDSHYIDTIGNADGTTGIAFDVDTETATLGADLPEHPGEGNFREFAVTRTLWDAIDDTPSETANGFSDNVSGAFAEIWAALSRPQYGFRDSAFAFRNVGLVHLAQSYMTAHPLGSDAAASDWSAIAGLNLQERGTSHYAQFLKPSTSGACTSAPLYSPQIANASPYYFQLSPSYVAGDDGTLSGSDIFLNNRFFHLHVDSSGAHTLQLIYQDDDGTSQLADLDLYVYSGKARFAVSSDILGMSRNKPAGAVTTAQVESVSKNFGAGDYLIDVSVYTGGGLGSPADYNLLLDGVPLCPANLVPQ